MKPYITFILASAILCRPVTTYAADDRKQLGHLYTSKVTKQAIHGFPGATYIEYSDSVVSSDYYGTKLCIIDAPAKLVKPTVRDTRSTQEIKGVFVGEAGPRTLAIINGGYFGWDGRGRLIPLGYVKSQGKQVSRITRWNSGGVLVMSHDQFRIEPIAKFRASDEDVNAIQSKPMLVEQGKDGIRTSTPERFDRSAVGLTSNGRVILAVLTNSLGSAGTLAEFSHLLATYRSSDSDRISWALAMDGGPGAHLYIPALKRHCGQGLVPFVPNVVAWEKENG